MLSAQQRATFEQRGMPGLRQVVERGLSPARYVFEGGGIAMLIRAGLVALALAASLAPSASNAADVQVGGTGPRVRGLDGHWISAHGRPVIVRDDRFAEFGDLQTATAPPLRIEVKGDVEIVPLENGGIRIKFIDE